MPKIKPKIETDSIVTIKKVEWFEKALKDNVRIFRSQSLCDCDDCMAYLQLGLLVTSNEDIQRLFDEQEKGVRFDIKQLSFNLAPKISATKQPQPIRAISTNTGANRRILNQLQKK